MATATFPISPSALTLADYAMQSNDPTIMKITESLLGDVSILDDLPLVTNESLKVRGGRITGSDLPTIQWGRINQLPADIKTTSKTFEENASMIRERIQIDRKLLKQKDWIDDPFQTQISGALAAHRYGMNHAFFLNDPNLPAIATGIDQNDGPDAWTGLKTRLLNPITYGLPLNSDGVTTNLNINAGGINLKQNMAAADANNLLEVIGQAFALMGVSDGRQCVAYTNWLGKERWNRGIRLLGAGGGFKTTADAFGRDVEIYRQCKVRDMGWRQDQVTTLISNTLDANGNETGAPGTGKFTEVYIVRYGDEHFKGWQTNELKAEDLGRSKEYGTYQNLLIDWACGFHYPNQRSFCRIYNLAIS